MREKRRVCVSACLRMISIRSVFLLLMQAEADYRHVDHGYRWKSAAGNMGQSDVTPTYPNIHIQYLAGYRNDYYAYVFFASKLVTATLNKPC